MIPQKRKLMIWSIAHLLTLLGIPLLSVMKDDQADFGDCRGAWGRLERFNSLYMSIQPCLGVVFRGPQLKHFIMAYGEHCASIFVYIFL